MKKQSLIKNSDEKNYFIKKLVNAIYAHKALKVSKTLFKC